MKSNLTAFVALAALALPATAPVAALAQDAAPSEMSSYQPDESAPPPQRMMRDSGPRPEAQPVQDRGGRGDRGDRGGGGRGDRGGDRGGGDNGGGWNRGGQDGDRGGRDRGDRGGNGGWNRPDQPAPPVVTPPTQDNSGRGGWDRNRDRNGGSGWNGGQDRGGRDRDRGGRDRDRDGRDRNGGGWNGGNNNGGWNGGWNDNRGGQDWNRDRNNGGRNWSDRNGRRDYDGFRNRWNQNDWRRDWNRRGNDWWRNDRGFRNYSGFRFGFYFAPNYGYYSVPRNYWGQRWYEGQYLPSIFWRYRLDDYRTFGLGYPPPGTQWVAVDNTIYLIDSFDGYIIEVIYDAWRW